jgi:hypothetical protein
MRYIERIILMIGIFLISLAAAQANPQGLSVSARELSLVGATLTRTEDAFGFQNNPATISFNQGIKIAYMNHEMYALGTRYQFAAATLTKGKFAVGLGIKKLSDADPEFLYRDATNYVSLGTKLKTVGLGINIKNRAFSLAGGRTGKGWAIDAGILGNIGDNMVAARIHDLSSTMKYSSGYIEKKEPEISLALGKTIWGNSCELSLFNWTKLRLGIERALSPAITLRLGLDTSKIGAGIGFEVFRIKTDYGIQINEVGMIQQISMGMEF